MVLVAGLWATGHVPWDEHSRRTTATTVSVTTAQTTATSVTGTSTGQSAQPSTDVVRDLGAFADSATKLGALLALLVGAWFALVRLGLWYTPLGARLHQRTSDNPMESVLAHFAWLRRQSDRPILIIIDDLDRCSAEYTVTVLETMQTLLRPSSHARARPPNVDGVENRVLGCRIATDDMTRYSRS